VTRAAPTPPVIDRRPIASRDRRFFQNLAGALAARGVSPNGISLAGMACALGAGVALAATGHVGEVAARLLWLAGAALIQLRLIANLLDGMVAIASGRASPIGELYNEVPDRISDAAVLIGLGYAAASVPELGYIAAALAIFTAYVRAVGRGAGLASDFRGPMAKPHRMFIVTVAAVSLGLMPGAWQPMLGSEGQWGIPAAALLLVILGCIVTAARRLAGVAAALRGHSQ
jgi:phosphatidylglycerophosphate synthase